MKPSQFCLQKKFILERTTYIEIESLLRETDVLAMLPRGFEKSLVFQGFAMVRLLLSVKWTSWNGCVLVVSPLKSIVSDQIEKARVLDWQDWKSKIQECLKTFPDYRTYCSTGFCLFSFMIYGMGTFLGWNMQPACTWLSLFISSANNLKSLECVQKFWKHIMQSLEKTAVSFSRTIPLWMHKSARTKCWKPSL